MASNLKDLAYRSILRQIEKGGYPPGAYPPGGRAGGDDGWARLSPEERRQLRLQLREDRSRRRGDDGH